MAFQFCIIYDLREPNLKVVGLASPSEAFCSSVFASDAWENAEVAVVVFALMH